MNSYQINLAIFLIFFSIISLISLSFLDKKKWLVLRKLDPLKRFLNLIGFSIEQGKRLHISLGRAKIEQISGASSIISLHALKKLSSLSNMTDKPPIVTSGSGDLSILTQDILKNSYKLNNALEKYDKNLVYMPGFTRYSYVAGLMTDFSEDLANQTVIGHIGPEIGLIFDTSQKRNIYSFAATDSLPGQSVSFAMADEVVFGEDIFAIPANLEESTINNASLQTQDFLRILAIVILIFSSLLKLVGIL